jgi:gamma-glutamylcysteine synthetase
MRSSRIIRQEIITVTKTAGHDSSLSRVCCGSCRRLPQCVMQSDLSKRLSHFVWSKIVAETYKNIQKNCRNVAFSLQKCCRNVAEMLQNVAKRCRNVAEMLQKCCEMLQKCCRNVAKTLQKRCKTSQMLQNTATFLQHFCNISATFLQHFCNISATFCMQRL